MTELEVSSNSLRRSDYLLSLAQVQITACSSGEVPLLNRSPISLCAEGNSAKMTNSKNKSLNVGAILGIKPSGQVGLTMGQMSSMEKQEARWDVSRAKLSRHRRKWMIKLMVPYGTITTTMPSLDVEGDEKQPLLDKDGEPSGSGSKEGEGDKKKDDDMDKMDMA